MRGMKGTVGPGNTLVLAAVAPFDLREVVRAHGWWQLAPFRWDEQSRVLTATCELGSAATELEVVASGEAGVEVRWVGDAESKAVATAVGRMLMLDADLSGFHRRCARRRRWRHVSERGLGRLLRSPSLWEDLVKILCTTNIAWSGTKGMVARLVEAFGALSPSGQRAFPSAAILAEAGADRMGEVARLGYRKVAVHELAVAVAEGRLDLATWADQSRSTPDLYREIMACKGFGPYAAACALALLGRYDFVPVDSAYLQHVRTAYANGADLTAAQIRQTYDAWGRWKFLAYWFDDASETVLDLNDVRVGP